MFFAVLETSKSEFILNVLDCKLFLMTFPFSCLDVRPIYMLTFCSNFQAYCCHVVSSLQPSLLIFQFSS